MIDLFSDTATKPTPAMRAAMAAAEVGDEQRGEDPTVNALQDEVAALLGKERAVFLPSGTMCNAISFLVHCRPGDEILLHPTAHPIVAEGGGPAALAGAVLTPLPGPRGTFTAEQVDAAVRPASRYSPRTRAVSVEQTTNMGGGACWPLESVSAVCAAAARNDLVAHMDGARLMNAVVATGVKAADFARGFDSVWIDFSKGLGAPVGAALAGSDGFITEAWRHKQRMGGAMRQAGVIAAAALHALRHHVERLADDHINARVLAEGVADLPGVSIDLDSVQTNIVFFDIGGTSFDADSFAARMKDEHGLVFSTVGRDLVRAVTHLDVSRADVEHALAGVRAVLG
ncbi:MAG TPA: GntG family PLP-dependent aldolase [Actinomycetota bacterium]|nr:GntG family PLP-dependent aldolase [Actinomycetota bacterium]